MLGPPVGSTARSDYSGPDRGLAPRMAELLFGAIAALPRQFEARVLTSFVEIYNEQIFDLLHPEKDKVKIHETAEHVWVACTEVPCASARDVFLVFDTGVKWRTAAGTEANAVSSRSHAILQLTVTIKDRATRTEQVSRLQLADLAGSEQVRYTGATGDRLVEAQYINR
jgi:hypothetical protein